MLESRSYNPNREAINQESRVYMTHQSMCIFHAHLATRNHGESTQCPPATRQTDRDRPQGHFLPAPDLGLSAPKGLEDRRRDLNTLRGLEELSTTHPRVNEKSPVPVQS